MVVQEPVDEQRGGPDGLGRLAQGVAPVDDRGHLAVLKKRYLKKNEKGEAIEEPIEMFRRVASNIAEGEFRFKEENAMWLGAEYRWVAFEHVSFVGFLDAAFKAQNRIRTISVHHEQTAGHMADAYFKVRHEPVATFTSCGPGSANLVVALAAAMMDSSAFFAITGNVPTGQFNRMPFQETGRWPSD